MPDSSYVIWSGCYVLITFIIVLGISHLIAWFSFRGLLKFTESEAIARLEQATIQREQLHALADRKCSCGCGANDSHSPPEPLVLIRKRKINLDTK